MTILLNVSLFNQLKKQEAAVTRALVLERKLNIELSEVITARYRSNEVASLVLVVYLFFIFGVLLLGGFVLQPEVGYLIGLVIFAFITAAVPFFWLGLSYVNKEFEEDWTISPLESTHNEPVRITPTNMSPNHKPIPFPQGTLIWRINNEDGQEIFTKTAGKDINVADNYTWILRPSELLKSKLASGVCQLQPRGWPRPLHRRIIVSDDTPK